MKKLLLSALIGLTALTGTAHADPHNRYGYAGGYYGYPGGHVHNNYGNRGYGYRHSNSDDWIAPAIIGGVIGYAINQASQPRTVYVQQQPRVIYQNIPPAGYHYEDILDASCTCYRRVLVQN